MSTPRTTRWRDHRSRWTGCDLCPAICAGRKVFGRGSLHPDILFLGIGPGEGEDTLGVPFVGPAGKILTGAIEFAEKKTGWHPTKFWSNLVLCRPTEGHSNRDPSEDEIENCRGRLRELLEITKPKAVIRLGRLVASHAPVELLRVQAIDLWHPAAILRDRSRTSGYQDSMARAFGTLRGRIED